MWDVLKPVSSMKLATKPRGEGAVFKLHYRATFLFVMACCILVTATQYIGDPIECMPDKDSLPQKVTAPPGTRGSSVERLIIKQYVLGSIPGVVLKLVAAVWSSELFPNG